MGHQVHRRALDAGRLRKRTLDVGLAGGARHAFDRQGDLLRLVQFSGGEHVPIIYPSPLYDEGTA